MTGLRFSALFNKFSTSSLHKLARFSSCSKANPKFSSFSCGDSECEGSLVYRHKLQFQRPPTVERQDWLNNSVSLIGSVLDPVKTVRTLRRENFGVHTTLKVNSSPDSEKNFRVLLKMWNKMAEISYKYLKQNDLIYVSGKLESYTKADMNGHSRIYYEVIVDELNYIACIGRFQNNQKTGKSEPKDESISTSSTPEIEKVDRLYLWQVFFVSPHEWWDNRKGKKSPWAPDFKHKDTGERLWLSPEDPPWVRRQLQLHDSRMAEQGYKNPDNFRSRVSLWKYDE